MVEHGNLDVKGSAVAPGSDVSKAGSPAAGGGSRIGGDVAVGGGLAVGGSRGLSVAAGPLLVQDGNGLVRSPSRSQPALAVRASPAATSGPFESAVLELGMDAPPKVAADNKGVFLRATRHTYGPDNDQSAGGEVVAFEVAGDGGVTIGAGGLGVQSGGVWVDSGGLRVGAGGITVDGGLKVRSKFA